MAYVNLPPNLKDMFYSLSDRIAKLETGPSQPMDYAVSAQGVSSQALTAANLANTQSTTAITLANTKNTVFYSGTSPTANAVNDQWIDTAHGNKLFIWNGTAWVSAQDAAISAAQTTANGKNAIYRQGTTPTGGTYVSGDMWFNTSSDNAISTWNGSSWVLNSLGNGALGTNISGSKISTGTIDASVVNVSNINAGNISTGYLAASRIQTGSLNANVITSNTITATQIAAGTITATEISSSYVYAGTIAAGNITTGTLTSTVTINGSNITCNTGTIGGFTLNSGYMYYSGTYLYSGGSGTYALYSDRDVYAKNLSANGYVTAASAGSVFQGTTFNGAITANSTLTMNGNFYNYVSATGTGSANAVINSSSGYLFRSTSSQRYKVEIEPQEIPVTSILALQPKSYVDKGDAERKGTTDGLPRYLGLIAEDVVQIPVLGELLANLDKENRPDSVNYDRIAIALIPLLKDHEARLNKLEGK